MTILLLEYPDVSLTRHGLIVEDLGRPIDGGCKMPGHVFIASTIPQMPMGRFWRPVIDGRFEPYGYFEEIAPRERSSSDRFAQRRGRASDRPAFRR